MPSFFKAKSLRKRQRSSSGKKTPGAQVKLTSKSLTKLNILLLVLAGLVSLFLVLEKAQLSPWLLLKRSYQNYFWSLKKSFSYKAQKQEESILNNVVASPQYAAKACSFCAFNNIGTEVRVLRFAKTPFEQGMIIDKGQNHGIAKDDPVIIHDAVVGRVLVALQDVSYVLLLTDQNSSVPATFLGTKTEVMLKGGGKNLLKISFSRQKDFHPAPFQKVVTSGVGGVFPPGLLIGLTARRDSSLVEPAFNKLNLFLLCVLRMKQTTKEINQVWHAD